MNKVSGAVAGVVNWGLPETCTRLNVPQVIKDRFPLLKLFGKCDGVDNGSNEILRWFNLKEGRRPSGKETDLPNVNSASLRFNRAR